MQITNIHDAKSQLSRLIELAYKGEEVIICKAGKPMVKLTRYQPESGGRTPGSWRGKVKTSPDFDDALPEIEAAFQGNIH
jgi:prevent-host-death family protein